MKRRDIAWKSLVLSAGIFLAGCADYPPPRQEPIPSAQNQDAPRYERTESKPLPPQSQPPAPAAPGDQYQH